MNSLMGAMNTSSGLKLNLRWRSKTAETEDQLDTKELVELLKKDYRLMREDEAAKLSAHFRSKVEEARRHARDSGGMISFYQVMKETLDYRKWFEFQLFFQKGGERVKELTNSMFGTFSGGEKAMAMYVPLFSAVVAKYQGGRPDAPRLISLDEAFAGVDNRNIRDMFRLMAEFQFDFIINSQVLWGDCDSMMSLRWRSGQSRRSRECLWMKIFEKSVCGIFGSVRSSGNFCVDSRRNIFPTAGSRGR